MKKIYTVLFVMALGMGAFIFQSASSGVGEVQGKDRTGAPGSDNPCSQCHNGGSFATSAGIVVVDPETQQPVTVYTPGQTYTVAPFVTGLGNPAAYGFQATAILDSDESNAGVFSDPQFGMQLEEVDGRHLIEHSEPSPFGAWTVDWVAPEAGSGDVTFYISGNAVNLNGSTSGDQYGGGSLTIGEGDNSVETYVENSLMEAFVNEANAIVITTDDELLNSQASLYDMQGRLVAQTQINNPITTWKTQLPFGTYIVSIENNGLHRTARVVLR